MKRSAIWCMSLMWGITGILFLGSIIGLSINFSLGTNPNTTNVINANGWNILSQHGVGEILRMFANSDKASEMNFWYNPNGINDGLILCGALSTVLIIVVPFLICFSLFVTYRVVLAWKMPRSIEFVDAIKAIDLAQKGFKNNLKTDKKLLKKNSITLEQFNQNKANYLEKISLAKTNYNQEYDLWISKKTNKLKWLPIFLKRYKNN